MVLEAAGLGFSLSLDRNSDAFLFQKGDFERAMMKNCCRKILEAQTSQPRFIFFVKKICCCSPSVSCFIFFLDSFYTVFLFPFKYRYYCTCYMSNKFSEYFSR